MSSGALIGHVGSPIFSRYPATVNCLEKLPKEGEYRVWFFLKMVCFFIAVNTESGRCKASPERRGPLQVVSLLLQVMMWVLSILVVAGVVVLLLLLSSPGNEQDLFKLYHLSFR